MYVHGYYNMDRHVYKHCACVYIRNYMYVHMCCLLELIIVICHWSCSYPFQYMAEKSNLVKQINCTFSIEESLTIVINDVTISNKCQLRSSQ